MRIIIYGADGVIGRQLVSRLSAEQDIEIVAEITPLADKGLHSLDEFQGDADMVIDFSHPSNLHDILAWGKKTGRALLLGTTGYDEADLELINQASLYCPVLQTGNTSIGVNILKLILEKTVSLIGDWDIEIIEKHHNRKKDSPSGTARELLHVIEKNNINNTKPVYGRSLGQYERKKGDIGIHAVRGGTIAGEHKIIFAGEDEVIELSHSALSRKIFVNGALRAARWLIDQPKGLYTMRDTFV